MFNNPKPIPSRGYIFFLIAVMLLLTFSHSVAGEETRGTPKVLERVPQPIPSDFINQYAGLSRNFVSSPGQSDSYESENALRSSHCETQSYIQNIAYVWKAPHPVYGDKAYAQRFSVVEPLALKTVGLPVYDPGDGTFGNDTVYVTVYYDDGAGLPGAMIQSVAVDPFNYPAYPAFTVFDFSPYNLVVDSDFHVAFSSSAIFGSGDYESLLSSDGSDGVGRSSSDWGGGSGWVDMLSGWGLDVNFYILVTLCNINQPPVLAPIGAQLVDENVNLNFGVSATDADSTIPTLSTSTLPTGATFVDNLNGTGTFDWTPTFTQSGIHNITFYAADSIATDSEVVAITVNNVNQQPVLASIGSQSVDEGANLNFVAAATDADLTTPTLSAVGVPTNATFVDNTDGTATFNFNPDFTQEGVFNVTIIASDSTLADSEVVAIIVNDICCIGNRGDLNGDGDDANILDLTFAVDRIFRGGPASDCEEEGDVNNDGDSVNILDLTFLVDRIFRGGPLPGPC